MPVTPANTNDPAVPITLPKRRAYLLAICAVFASGLLGGFAGYGISDTGCSGSCLATVITGALVGTLIAGGGTAVVATLMLRARAEWRAHPAPKTEV